MTVEVHHHEAIVNILHFSPSRFPAAVLRTRPIGDFLLTETRYGSDASLDTHAHEYACLVLVLEGSFHERYGSAQRVGQPGMLIVRPEGELHSDRFEGAGGRCLNIELAPRWLQRVRECSPAFDGSAAFTGGAFPLHGRRLLDELKQGDDMSALAVESLVLAMVTDTVRGTRRSTVVPPRWLRKARELIHDRFTTRITLEELAGATGVHPVHLATTFRRFYGHTVAAAIRELRIEYACRELSKPDSTLAGVALAAGFADQSHFGRTFKRSLGMTPAQYRSLNPSQTS